MVSTQSAFAAYLALSLMCALINIVPTISHLAQGHSGPASFGLWVVILNLLGFINGFFWRHDAMDKAPIYCDISAKVGLVGPLGLLMANSCIIRYLARIVTPKCAMETERDARVRIYTDYALAFGFPVVIAAASVIFQVARYQVQILVGCSNVSVLAWPTLIIFLVWPPVMCGLSCGYALYVLYWLIRQHHNLRQLVARSTTSLSMSRFLRMCALAATYLCISAPYTIVGTITTLYDIGPFVPWKSWRYIHDNDNKLSNVRKNPIYQMNLRDWLSITAGLTVFFFFSFASESLTIYVRLAHALHLPALCKRAWKNVDTGFRRKQINGNLVYEPAGFKEEIKCCTALSNPQDCYFVEVGVQLHSQTGEFGRHPATPRPNGRPDALP